MGGRQGLSAFRGEDRAVLAVMTWGIHRARHRGKERGNVGETAWEGEREREKERQTANGRQRETEALFISSVDMHPFVLILTRSCLFTLIRSDHNQITMCLNRLIIRYLF